MNDLKIFAINTLKGQSFGVHTCCGGGGGDGGVVVVGG